MNYFITLSFSHQTNRNTYRPHQLLHLKLCEVKYNTLIVYADVDDYRHMQGIK